MNFIEILINIKLKIYSILKVKNELIKDYHNYKIYLLIYLSFNL
jgi:hypothetical protein